jgi:hypothetical protein
VNIHFFFALFMLSSFVLIVLTFFGTIAVYVTVGRDATVSYFNRIVPLLLEYLVAGLLAALVLADLTDSPPTLIPVEHRPQALGLLLGLGVLLPALHFVRALRIFRTPSSPWHVRRNGQSDGKSGSASDLNPSKTLNN